MHLFERRGNEGSEAMGAIHMGDGHVSVIITLAQVLVGH